MAAFHFLLYTGFNTMALFKQRVTRPLPTNAEIITQKGKQFAKWKDRRGRVRTAELTPGGRIATEASTWSIRYRDGDGIVRTVATGCKDKTAANAKLTELASLAERVRVGALTTKDLEIGDHSKTPVSVHVKDYIADLNARGVNSNRIKTSETRLIAACEGCGFRWLRDLNAESLRKWLRGQTGMSAATYNWHATLWVAFGNWLTGVRLDGKRPSQTGERRLLTNPFNGFGKRDEKADRRRIARALTMEEMRLLLVVARSRPLDEARTIRRGKNKGLKLAKVSDARREDLKRLGLERALIYKTLILTGLRSNELRTLRVNDLSFGDIPFLALRVSNEKNRKGSPVPLKSDLASELRAWCTGKRGEDLVFVVPDGLLRILNRDLDAAGIEKIDDSDGRIHVHAMRHSTGTHLSAAGVSPRTAQAVMRHSDISLTMTTYTDEKLLATSGAVELLPELPILDIEPSLVTPLVTLDADNLSATESVPGKLGGNEQPASDDQKTTKPRELRGFVEWAIENSNLWPLPCESNSDESEYKRFAV